MKHQHVGFNAVLSDTPPSLPWILRPHCAFLCFLDNTEFTFQDFRSQHTPQGARGLLDSVKVGSCFWMAGVGGRTSLKSNGTLRRKLFLKLGCGSSACTGNTWLAGEGSSKELGIDLPDKIQEAYLYLNFR